MNELDISSSGSSTSSVSDDTSTPVTTDSDTLKRIKALAIVGTALFETTNEIGFQTKFFEAKEALNEFREAIGKMNLDDESKKGMTNLINYLQGKIDRRLAHSETQNEEPMK